MSESVREWSGGPPECPGKPGSGREVLPDVRESPGVFWRPSRMFGSGLEALPDVREWSGGPPEFPGVVGSLSRMSGSDRVALPDVREWSGGPPGSPGVSGSGREALPDV